MAATANHKEHGDSEIVYVPHSSAQEYPVFTPSYEDEPLPAYRQILLKNNQACSLSGENDSQTVLSDRNSLASSCAFHETSSLFDYSKSRINSLRDVKLVYSQPRTKGLNFSWLFPKINKKKKSEHSPIRSQVSGIPDDMVSIEILKKQLITANQSRDATLIEVSEMKLSLEELSQKLASLETHCNELKRALITKPAQNVKSLQERGEDPTVENFLEIVLESRVSVKRFCKILIKQIRESNDTLVADNLNLLLQPYSLSLNSKRSKEILYHLEALINRSLYQDFENCVFRKNGASNLLDPEKARESKFKSFVDLRNLSWNEVLRKGTKFYSEEFSKFCDEKMNGLVAILGWTGPWPEQLIQAFFAAAKSFWLLHLLAFSFDPALGILRVDENRPFESHYMEDIFAHRQKSQGSGLVKIMVMPGFYVHGRVLKCKVLLQV